MEAEEDPLAPLSSAPPRLRVRPPFAVGIDLHRQQEDAMDDPRRIVADGYDRAAERHAEWALHTRVEERLEYARLVLDSLDPGARVLELGCGAGGPTSRMLAERHRLVGVDLSWRNLQLARRNVPSAAFVQADMARLALRPGSVDAVVAFYSIIHLPRGQHAALFRAVAEWLKPGGVFAASFGTRDCAGEVEDDWLGVRMYSSSHAPATTEALVRGAGFRIERARVDTADEDGRPVPFLWIVARS
jgi:cyclopropane fatty-acyl-phospholipid synthase-like methyltransferase